MAGGAVHIAPYREARQLIGWQRENESYVASRIAAAGWDYRRIEPGPLLDLTYGAFVDLALSENGKKKMEAIEQINEKMRGKREPTVINATILPDEKPVNERD